MKPVLQTGTHVVPEAEFTTQVPGSELAIVGRVVQAAGTAVQVPVLVQVPALQVAEN